ncbi:MAG TPA: MiaB/RimO family radical SAM methylthiotransferase, partial [Sphingomicrobium sp.]|nr:MiaB/RimO family radical SAM methylthiotransferase [Sphingomicrobium sp.]
NPGSKLVITGCYAQRAPGEVSRLDGVWLVVGNSHKHQLGEIALGSNAQVGAGGTDFIPLAKLTAPGTPAAPIFVSDIFAHSELLAAPVFDSANERTRPVLKVQDSCNNRCSFCIIPSVRGKSRSLPLEEAVRQVEQLVEAGYREVVISGINLGRWGRDLRREGAQRAGLTDLIDAILAQTKLRTLRISSVEPMDWSEPLIERMAASPRIAKHTHVPMQSGSDRVLRRMHRRYRPWHYREKIERIRAAMPEAAIGADVMTGFPGETESEFRATCRMVEELPFTYLHVFTFSPRPGTPAASAPDPVPEALARERNLILRRLAEEKRRAFMRSLVGRRLDAITLNLRAENAGGTWTQALTDNYVKLRLAGQHERNRWLAVKVDAVEGDSLMGAVAGP